MSDCPLFPFGAAAKWPSVFPLLSHRVSGVVRKKKQTLTPSRDLETVPFQASPEARTCGLGSADEMHGCQT